jgi:hypothetical protein
MKFDVDVHARGVDYARFSRVYFSERFGRELLRVADLIDRTVHENVLLPDGKRRMRVSITPRVHVPAALRALVAGYAIRYEETCVFDMARRSADYDVQTMAGHLLRVNAQGHFSDTQQGVRLRITTEVVVGIPLLGARLERMVAQETIQRYALVEHALQEYLDAGRDAEDAP